MAKIPNSAVVLRFVFGRGLVQGRQRTEDTARAIVRNLAVYYADAEFDKTKAALRESVEKDVRNELVHMAQLYRRFIIGANGNTRQPAGVLTTVAKGAGRPTATVRSMLPAWAPRSARYLARKAAGGGGNKWFDNRGWRARKGQTWAPESTGELFEGSRAEVWEDAFGPISVRFLKRNKNSVAEVEAKFGNKTHARVLVGSVQVRALGLITPDMLPGLSSGNIKASASGNKGLINLVRKVDPDLAYRLGTMNNGIYRPTLEPFLGFFLTRSIRQAVNARITKGNTGTLFRR